MQMLNSGTSAKAPSSNVALFTAAGGWDCRCGGGVGAAVRCPLATGREGRRGLA